MSRAIKILLLSLVVLLVVVVGAVVAAAMLFDPNDYKPQIEAQVQQQTGRSFSIEGDLELALFPWLRVTSGPAALCNAAGFDEEPFARIEGLEAGVRVWPLLRGEVQLGRTQLHGLALRLQVDAEGRDNWSDLIPETEPEEPPQEEDGLLDALEQLRIAGVEVRGASVSFEDAQADVAYALEGFNLTLGALAPGVPMDASFDFALSQQDPPMRGQVEGRGVLRLEPAEERVQLSDLVVDAQLEGGEDAPLAGAQARLRIVSMEMSLGAGGHRLSGLTVDARVLDPELPDGELEVRLAAASLEADPAAGEALLDGLELETLGMVLQATFEASGLDAEAPVLIGRFEVAEFSPRTALTAFAPDYQPRDDAVLTRARARGEVRVEGDRFELSGFDAGLDDTVLAGWLRGEGQRLEFDFEAGEIDVDRYLPPEDDTEVETEEMALDEIEIPADALQAWQALGEVRVAAVTAAGFALQDLVVRVEGDQSEWRLQPAAALFDGRYTGDVRLNVEDAEQPALSVDDRLENVQLAALSQALYEQAQLMGRVDATVQLAAAGRTVGDMRRSLDGEVAFALSDGAWEGVDLEFELRRAAALLRQQAAPEAPDAPRTEFSDIRAGATIEDGVMHTDELHATLRFLQLDGQGAIDLAQGTLSYQLDALILDHPDLEDAPVLSELRGVSFPLSIDGPLTGPNVRPDFGALLREEGLGRLRDEVLRQLRPEEEADGDAQEEADDGPERPQDRLRRGLRDLLGE